MDTINCIGAYGNMLMIFKELSKRIRTKIGNARKTDGIITLEDIGTVLKDFEDFMNNNLAQYNKEVKLKEAVAAIKKSAIAIAEAYGIDTKYLSEGNFFNFLPSLDTIQKIFDDELLPLTNKSVNLNKIDKEANKTKDQMYRPKKIDNTTTIHFDTVETVLNDPIKNYINEILNK